MVKLHRDLTNQNSGSPRERANVHHFDFRKSSHLQPLAATWQPLGSHLLRQPLAQAATWQPLGSHLQPLAQAATWQQVAASGCLNKWLQVAAFLKIKLRTSCAHNGFTNNRRNFIGNVISW